MERVSDLATAQRLISEVEDIDKPTRAASLPPTAEPPPDLTYPLCGWYLQGDGSYARTFEVRELTGRDEEYIAKSKDIPKMLTSMLERGLVKVGNEPADEDTLSGLLAGDWETVLLAIRRATFGDTYAVRLKCADCGKESTAEIDLAAIPLASLAQSEDRFEVIGRHGVQYVCTPSYGSAQQLVMTANATGQATVAELNTIILKESIQTIGARPVITRDDITNLPLADRRKLLVEIDKRKCGPDLMGVKTACPECGAMQDTPLNVVAMFQG